MLFAENDGLDYVWRAARRFAVEPGLSLGDKDRLHRTRTRELWEQTHARGVMLLGGKHASARARAHAGFGVAASS